ncbi:TetR/AcrR family transcriptional regulator [Mycolicibacterium helvum]|uniref:HTH tetR-type domain-containing protein n=1 Tax=Mycolicibacterium helvum TaxID=1534349 RepID=A0A7I7T5P8_9MYCO|nr:TetR/AcrR family transcriptional regulator [Mycolicibacterium helvum]BBY63819.1 hypothetical protein MHEL_20620 [Mycolicibacterium helvum]
MRYAIDVLRTDADASMTTLAAGVGIHRATLYRHFPTREALIARLTERATTEGRRLVDEIAELDPSRDAVRRLAAAITDFGDRYRFLVGTAPVLHSGADPIGLIPLMRQWQKAGIVRKDLPAQWLAVAFTALAIALEDHSGPLSMDVEPGDRPRLIFEMFTEGANVRSSLDG